MTPDELRSRIREELPEGIQQMVGILRNPKSSDGNKIKAFSTLADRGGIPEIKATVTQNISAKVTVDDLQEQRQSLLGEQESIMSELKTLKAGGLEEAIEQRRSVLPQPDEQEGTTG